MLIPLFTSLLSLLFGLNEAELVFAGDAMMHQIQIDVAKQDDGTYDFSEYFTAITPWVSNADYAVVNLETSISKPPYSGYPCFNAPVQYVEALADAGFDMFLTANNHTLDRNDRGLRATIANLDERHLDHIGTYTNAAARDSVLPYIKNINGIKFGFLNYTYGTNGITSRDGTCVDYIDRALIATDVAAARRAGAEIIVLCIHWGDENRMLPNNTQRDLAEYIKSLDVDIIVGSHPHVVQPVELVERPDGRPQLLIYSLGNFISNMTRRDNRGGMMMRVVLRRGFDGIVNIVDADYRLVFTEPYDGSHNFRLQWVDKSEDPRAGEFARSARAIFDEHNVNITEDIP